MYKWMVTGLSAILPGAGQLLNHEWVKGGITLAVALIASGMLRRKSVLLSDFNEGSPAHLALIAVLLGLAVWSAVDAYRHSSHPAH
ncbi:MAG TPA: hypothetical protein VI702_02210 [Nitrospiria bacterium]